jgi:hypothetical protein
MTPWQFQCPAGITTLVFSVAGIGWVLNILPMQEQTIRHTVAFTLKHEPGSPAAQKFLRDGQRILTAIPGVRNFECLRQVSRKNSFQYGFSMEFKDQSAYDAYNQHPDHTQFVAQRWMPEVREFLEIDYRGWLDHEPA